MLGQWVNFERYMAVCWDLAPNAVQGRHKNSMGHVECGCGYFPTVQCRTRTVTHTPHTHLGGAVLDT